MMSQTSQVTQLSAGNFLMFMICFHIFLVLDEFQGSIPKSSFENLDIEPPKKIAALVK